LGLVVVELRIYAKGLGGLGLDSDQEDSGLGVDIEGLGLKLGLDVSGLDYITAMNH